MERISRCISLRSWLRSRRWMKLERTSLFAETFKKAICAVTQPKQHDRRSVTVAGALVTIVSPLRTAVTEGITRPTGSRNKIKHSEHAPHVTCGACRLGPCAPLHGNLGMGFIEALREGRGSWGLKWDRPSMERLGECVSGGCSMHIAALSVSARLYLGNKIAWVWTL